MPSLLKGAPVAKAITAQNAQRASELAAQGMTPKLAIVRVGERPDDLSYERAALKRAEKSGLAVTQFVLPQNAGDHDVSATLDKINNDASIHGCLLFRPLPAHLDEPGLCAQLAAEKDMDGITQGSLFGVFSGQPKGFAPCTAEAVVALLDHYQIPLDGARVCVVGRSLVIGKPVAMLLLERNATVTIAHTHTRDLAATCKAADIVVVAAGHARTIGSDAVHKGQVVVDVGINWDEATQSLVGDVDFDAVADKVAAITPVPGGVGSVTTAILCKHVIDAAGRSSWQAKV